MRFSVIIPVYNVEQYLEECLESVINQSYSDYEIICVDDASTDGSSSILLLYAQKYPQIKIVQNSRNQGLSYSRNKGLSIAEGDYILFVDSDDYIEKGTLEGLSQIINKKKFDIVYFNYKRKDENGITINKRNNKYNYKETTGQKLFIECSKNNDFITPAWLQLFHRKFLKENKFLFYNGILHEDILFSFQCILRAQSVYYINEFFYVYRKRGDSITINLTEKHLDSLIINICEIVSLWKNSDLIPGMDEAIRAYIGQYFPYLRRLRMCFPSHRKLDIGTPADQFLFDIMNDIEEQSFRFVRLENVEINQIKEYERIIIFGAGTVASELIACLGSHNIHIDAVAVSEKNDVSEISGIHIYQIEELIDMGEDALVIIGVIKRSQELIFQRLKSLGFKHIMRIDTEKVAT